MKPGGWKPVVQIAGAVFVLLVFGGVWLFDYMSQFGMLATGRIILVEIEAELVRLGARCENSSAIWVSEPVPVQQELSGRSRFIESLSITSAAPSLLDVRAQMKERTASAPWHEGVEQGETMLFRFRCEERDLSLWCVGNEEARLKFRGAFLTPCPADGLGDSVDP